MRLLKDAQDALEREYLRGRQQLPGAAEGFDPDRAVEEEIYRLGLRLEGLKERLEPGGRRQPSLPSPPQTPPQPCCAPAPSPPPATHSPRPESPVLVEGPLGTAGDNEVMEGLPWPLWHKQLQVEEDFGDLLKQYKHFKSLPESLSLEQLSLVESGSQEEVDAPAAGDGGPSKVPCRTRSLEEGADLDTFPLHPPERRAAPLPPGGPPKAEGTRGHPSPATTEEPLATTKPGLGVPGPPRAPLSRRSSGMGSAATQPGPRKEQRIVSPETDSGFVGSEASRVSPPVHTPEHRPPGTGQAIRELRAEVWRLRRRLEESLRRSRSYPEGKATPRIAPARRQPVGSSPSSPQDAAPSGALSPPMRGRVAPGVTSTQRGRSASLPQDRPELDLTERGTSATSPPDSHVGARAEKPEQSGFWYLAPSPAATVCLAPVPVVPYVPSVLYCSPAVPTSALTAGHRRAQHRARAHTGHHCLSLDLEELDELNWSLSRAMEAAQSVRLTTTRMSRALAAELGRSRDLRGSCLF
ncbi:hypothetical protein WISP_97849 [Willisornis vidua]|uniref:AKNA factor n=1 Tax=Willisornis vidua TaxID=1566151 RepID=A0ABQ9CZI7_9PASS|nr:hypothetical protein WISP_97849 [Willisornis vidua]